MEPIWIAVAAGAVVLLVVLLLLLGRSRERVIDMAGAPVSGRDAADAADAPVAPDKIPRGATGPGEVLEAKGKDDAECGLADWLMDDVNRALGGDYTEDPAVITRVADAALKASASLKTTGQATVELPFLAADAAGPKHYRRDITRQEAEPGMVEYGALLVDELVAWRGRDKRTVALARWLEYEADDDAGKGSLDPTSTVRLADAAERAMADVARDGQAIVDLPGLTREDGGAIDFHRELDRESLDEAIRTS